MALSRFEEVSLWHFSKKTLNGWLHCQWLTTLSILPYLHHVTKQCFTDHHGPVSCTALQSCQTYRIFSHLKLLYRATSMTNTCRLSTVSAKWQLTSFVKLEYLYLGATFLSFCSMNKAQVCSPSWIHQNPFKKNIFDEQLLKWNTFRYQFYVHKLDQWAHVYYCRILITRTSR